MHLMFAYADGKMKIQQIIELVKERYNNILYQNK